MSSPLLVHAVVLLNVCSRMRGSADCALHSQQQQASGLLVAGVFPTNPAARDTCLKLNTCPGHCAVNV
jgi:hypothetical protein